MTKIFSRLSAFLADYGAEREEGQGVVEYALVLGVLVVAIFVAFITTPIGDGIENAISQIIARLGPAAT
jgi:Flp pilus assembly pilin Flp